MNFMPVEMFDHIVINAAGKPWAVFELREPPGMTSYRFHSDSAMINYAGQILSWVRGLPLEARLLSVAEPLGAEQLSRAVADAPHLITTVSHERHRALQQKAAEAGDLMVEQPAHRRHHFLCVTLDSADNIRSTAAEAMTQVTRLAGKRRAPSSLARRQELLAAAELTLASLGPLVRPATAAQVRWLMQRAICRGLDEQPAPPRRGGRSRGRGAKNSGAGNGQITPTSQSSRPLIDATLVEGGERRLGGLPSHRQMLRVESTYGDSYQTTLVMASMPPEWRFPDSGYWMAVADEFDFPVDVTLRVYSPPQHETKKQFRRRHKELASQPDQYSGTTSGVPDSVFELIDRSNAAQSKLEGSRLNRIHRVLTCYTVAADSPEELKRRVATVKAELASNGYEAHAPTGDQNDLFHLGLPGTAIRPGGVVADYDQDLTAEAIASGLPGLTPALGDERGAYLGRRLDIGPAMPVLLSPSVTTSASTMGFGASGGGKSFTAKTIALSELIGGAQVVAIDRTNRGEYVQFATGLPEFLTSEVVDLSGEAQVSLCPMSTFPAEDRIEITTSFLCLLAGVGARTMDSARIAQAAEYVGEHPGGTTYDVLDVLRQWGNDGDDLSRDLFYRIAPLARTRFAQLAFQPGQGISVRGADLIVLHARGLVLPSKEELRSGNDLDASKAASIAMVYLLMALADAIGNAPDRLSSIVLDEAWAFLESSFGIDLANRVLRDGRKDFKKLQLWSQHPSDAPTDLLNMASNVFLTRQVEGAGATALEMVGAEPTPELIAMVEQLGIGEMVMRDEHGRLGVIQVDPPTDPAVAAAFDTRPRSGEAYSNGGEDERPVYRSRHNPYLDRDDDGRFEAGELDEGWGPEFEIAGELPPESWLEEPRFEAGPVPSFDRDDFDADPTPYEDGAGFDDSHQEAYDPSYAGPVAGYDGAATVAPGHEFDHEFEINLETEPVAEESAPAGSAEHGLEVEPDWEPERDDPADDAHLPAPMPRSPEQGSDLFERLERAAMGHAGNGKGNGNGNGSTPDDPEIVDGELVDERPSVRAVAVESLYEPDPDDELVEGELIDDLPEIDRDEMVDPQTRRRPLDVASFAVPRK